MTGGHINVLSGSTFVVSDGHGDIASGPGDPTGLFFRDMRHLSRWELRLNGQRLDLLSAETLEYHEAVFFLAENTGTVYRDSTMSLFRRRRVTDGMHETLEVHNHGLERVTVDLSLAFAADFADLFEVKDVLAKRGELTTTVNPNRIVLSYQRGGFQRQTHIHAPAGESTMESIRFVVSVEPGASWSTTVTVTVHDGTMAAPVRSARGSAEPSGLEAWLEAAPVVETDWPELSRLYRRSVHDLAALRFSPDGAPGSALPAAGLPWFMALFGRDSLITSFQTLPFTPELARTTLLALGARQAHQWDDFRDAEPGKILHELRHGELAVFGERPQSPYFGSADSTPLYLILLDEYERWTGDVETVRRLEPVARAAVDWLDHHGDRDGDGYVEYQTRNPRTGLENQCWKDSWDSIVHPDGRLATLPRATCEIQGYVYDARRRMARLAREVFGDEPLAQRLHAQAQELRERFDRDFWLEEEGFFALALDGDKQPVATLASNIGHLLWSGIVTDERVERVVAHLASEEMFSGWGVRTLAARQLVFNPIGYHNGAVWPHDTALIAAGLARYGRRHDANRLAVALIEASAHFAYRLPEAFAGYGRAQTRVPVAFPTACSPQAWATGAPLLLLRVLLGLDPADSGLIVRPLLPAEVNRLVVRGLPGRWGGADAVALRD